MAKFTIFQPLWYMDGISMGYGDIISETSTLISLSNIASGGVSQEYIYGTFKYNNGDVASGIITRYDYFENGEKQYNITGLKFNAKTFADLMMGNNDIILPLMLNGNDIIDARPLQDIRYTENYLFGFNGNDIIYSGGQDFIHGGDGKDTIYGGVGGDTIHGDNGNDIIHGSNQFNRIYGGDGNDIIYGGVNVDYWIGDTSNEFYFDTKLGNSNKDTIKNFVSTTDQIWLDVSIFKSLTANGNLADNLVIGTKALDSNDYLIFNPKTHTLSYDADGSGTGKAVAFVVLTGVTTLSVETLNTLSDIFVY
jgi:Ca2+-binding RTX toxin-like protein